MKAKIISIIDSKTIKVSSTTYKKHEKYGKYITTSKNYLHLKLLLTFPKILLSTICECPK